MVEHPRPFTDPSAVLQAAATLAAAKYSSFAMLRAGGQLQQKTASASGVLVKILQEMADFGLIPYELVPQIAKEQKVHPQ